ncbi:MAG: TfoX/Sxy family protein [Bacteroidia bacterium]|nr:TfoX/Sxy family protein [Bacteroidia bacterium]
MAYDTQLADKIREYLAAFPKLKIEEKEMFKGLAFMVNGKMCVNVSGENLMCRFDPSLQEELAEKKGFLPMIMKGKELKGYCYVEPEGFKSKKDFEYWINLCLSFNDKAKASKKKKK